MNKILLVTSREYFSRVKKKSFIIMTLLGPLLMTALYGGLIYVSLPDSGVNESQQNVLVLDQSGLFNNQIDNTKTLHFEYVDYSVNQAQDTLKASTYYDALLIIPEVDINNIKGMKLIFNNRAPSISMQGHIEKALEKQVENQKLAARGIDRSTLDSLQTNINIIVEKQTEKGNSQTSTGAFTIAGIISALLIYMFIFLYGVQVMKGVIEEKTNRIVEVIISSVKPFQLMMGKILGIALVGLTQFVVWVVLSLALTTAVGAAIGFNADMAKEVAQTDMSQMNLPGNAATNNLAQGSTGAEMVKAISSLNFPLILGCFLFYFITGYLFYSALFAAVGSAVDSETDTQQFMLPITLPLVFAFVVAQTSVMTNPNGPLAVWMSMIPFTSPVVMMVRVPFGVPVEELIASMALMIVGFVFTTWLAARIYRTGILMYGKKASYREVFKWLFYKG